MYVCMYVRTYVRMYMYVYIYTIGIHYIHKIHPTYPPVALPVLSLKLNQPRAGADFAVFGRKAESAEEAGYATVKGNMGAKVRPGVQM